MQKRNLNLTSRLAKTVLTASLFTFFSILSYSQTESPIYSLDAIHHPIIAKNGMVASQHPEATKAGIEILQRGGNAVDAAVAVGFSLAVVLPRAGNLGGGGFMLVHDSDSRETHAINYREMAPKKSSRDMYLDAEGKVNTQLARSSYLAAGVPGTVAGLCLALENYGTMSLQEVLEPAIRLARDGFPITYDLARILKQYAPRLKKWPETAKIFYGVDGSLYEAGDLLVQRDLANSLIQIAEGGSKAFYTGEIAEKIEQAMQKYNGLIDKDDLAKYEPVLTKPVWGKYNEYEIASMPPPSSGGVHLIQMLNILESYDLSEIGHNSASAIHLLTEVMKRAYADRSQHLGDPQFWDVPVEGIISEEYADQVRKSINGLIATPSDEIAPGEPNDFESDETTHFSVVDKDGNVVSNTYTLNFSFGNGAVVQGTGILLNNEMNDFSAKPGTPNAFGLLGGEANSIQAGKRPLSSMTPSIVFKNGKPYFATGSPGGSRIITTVLQLILNVIEYDMNVAEASHAPRIHHQWYPDVLYYEKGISIDTRKMLENLGHQLQPRSAMGSTQSILIQDGLLFGASDPRRPDATTLGF